MKFRAIPQEIYENPRKYGLFAILGGCGMGWGVKLRLEPTKLNKINGFMHVFYGMALT